MGNNLFNFEINSINYYSQLLQVRQMLDPRHDLLPKWWLHDQLLEALSSRGKLLPRRLPERERPGPVLVACGNFTPMIPLVLKCKLLVEPTLCEQTTNLVIYSNCWGVSA